MPGRGTYDTPTYAGTGLPLLRAGTPAPSRSSTPTPTTASPSPTAVPYHTRTSRAGPGRPPRATGSPFPHAPSSLSTIPSSSSPSRSSALTEARPYILDIPAFQLTPRQILTEPLPAHVAGSAWYEDGVLNLALAGQLAPAPPHSASSSFRSQSGEEGESAGRWLYNTFRRPGTRRKPDAAWEALLAKDRGPWVKAGVVLGVVQGLVRGEYGVGVAGGTGGIGTAEGSGEIRPAGTYERDYLAGYPAASTSTSGEQGRHGGLLVLHGAPPHPSSTANQMLGDPEVVVPLLELLAPYMRPEEQMEVVRRVLGIVSEWEATNVGGRDAGASGQSEGLDVGYSMSQQSQTGGHYR